MIQTITTRRSFKTLFLIFLLAFLTGCAATGKYSNPADPYEGFNRGVHKFNKKLDTYALKPIARLYKAIVPKPISRAISNFFGNLGEVPTVINDVLQANFYLAISDSWRFLINTTVGVGGLFDVATQMDLPRHKQDLGLTLARWGYTKSAYLVLPFFGPNTVRDAIALPINYSLFTVYPHIQNIPLRNSLIALNIVNRRATLLDLEKLVNQASFDPYVFERNAYLQRRKFLIKRISHTESEPTDDKDDVYLETGTSTKENQDDEYYLEDETS